MKEEIKFTVWDKIICYTFFILAIVGFITAIYEIANLIENHLDNGISNGPLYTDFEYKTPTITATISGKIDLGMQKNTFAVLSTTSKIWSEDTLAEKFQRCFDEGGKVDVGNIFFIHSMEEVDSLQCSIISIKNQSHPL